MTDRERILAALDHRQPDRLPMDLGTTRFTSMVQGAYDKLHAHLGVGQPALIHDRTQQLVAPDEAILRYFDVDARALAQGPPDRRGDEELGEDRYRDEWGVVRRKPPGCFYYDVKASPLSGSISERTVAAHQFTGHNLHGQAWVFGARLDLR